VHLVIAPSLGGAVRRTEIARSSQVSSLRGSSREESVQLPVRMLMAMVPGRAPAYLALRLVAGSAGRAHVPCRFPAQQSP
jgi:hypothetical protein